MHLHRGAFVASPKMRLMLSPSSPRGAEPAGLLLIPVGERTRGEDSRQRVVSAFAADVFVAVVFGARFAASTNMD